MRSIVLAVAIVLLPGVALADGFIYLHCPSASLKVSDGQFNPHKNVPVGCQSMDSGRNKIPSWFPGHAKVVNGALQEMSAAEKVAVDAARDDVEKARQLDRRALRAVVKVLLREINVLRQSAGLAPITGAQLRSAIKGEMN